MRSWSLRRSHLVRRPIRSAGVVLALALGVVAGQPAGAVSLTLVLDPGQSALTQSGSSSPLSGSVGLALGALPPLAANTSFDVVALAASGGGLSIALDATLANPGLGVLFTGGGFLVPSLFLTVDGSELTVVDVVGSFGPSAACGGELCLETAFDVDPGTGGIVNVAVVAAVVPEPAVPLLLACVALVALALGVRPNVPAPGRRALLRRRRVSVYLVLVAALGLQGANRCRPAVRVVQERQLMAGFQEPHTPGSGAPEEFVVAADSPILQILGDDPDLNRVEYVRTRLDGASAPPRAILILVPGFLGGAGTFDPIARDLVRKLNGNLEVWALDRRSSLLEDRRGALHARAGAEAGQAAGDPDAVLQALAEGVRFYFPDANLDLDGDTVPDGPFPLPDAVPADGDSGFQKLAQDDVRFATYWGADTYARDWREVVLAARAVVGDSGLVLFGGHSLGTAWAGVYAAYDFDPGPAVEAGHELVDGLLLLEGGGPGAGTDPPLNAFFYNVALMDLLNGTNAGLRDLNGSEPGCQNPVACDSDMFLADLFGFVDAVDIGAAGELNGIAGFFQPDAPSIVQTTPVFGGIPVNILLQAPMTNRSLPGFFLDDDFSTNAAFSASVGFSANGDNVHNPIPGLVPGSFYIGLDQGIRRTWINYDSPRFDPGDPDPLTCPPIPPPPFPEANVDVGETGCAIVDNGPKPLPGEPRRQWGLEREVTDMDVLIRTLFETGNASEWYFIDGRPGLDLLYGRDSSGLGDPALLNVSQNANVDVPVLAIGGSNGLATTEDAFASYLGSIASTDVEIVILEGYAHVDVISAADNEAVPPIVDWVNRLLVGKLLGN